MKMDDMRKQMKDLKVRPFSPDEMQKMQDQMQKMKEQMKRFKLDVPDGDVMPQAVPAPAPAPAPAAPQAAPATPQAPQ